MECCDIWKDWRDFDFDVKSIKGSRNRLIEDRYREMKFSCDVYSLFVLK